ncbi:MAG: HNH endonuclease [Marinosulfonomonas sp.]|nr:HNH endonuclease [Marinosulfonomonas sp.]
MMSPSRHVPVALKRKLFEEAGYRCAVPTCRGASALEVEHIDEWSVVKEHLFENLIVLCATCHSRVTRGEIEKSAIQNYKANLAIISGRYSLFEMRLIETFELIITDGYHAKSYKIAENDLLHVKGLIDDGLIRVLPGTGTIAMDGMSVAPVSLVLTEAGSAFVRQYFSGKKLE